MSSDLFNLDKDKAACSTTDPDVFFPEGEDALQTEAYAKHVCGKCEVKHECLLIALTNGYQGIWGGTNEEERKYLRKTRKQLPLK